MKNPSTKSKCVSLGRALRGVGANKKQAAAHIYKVMVTHYQRKDIIEVFQKGADLTKNGASTYHANFKYGKWNWNRVYL